MAIMACSQARANVYEVYISFNEVEQECVQEENVKEETVSEDVTKKVEKDKIQGGGQPLLPLNISQPYFLINFHSYREYSDTKRAARTEMVKAEADLTTVLIEQITPFAALQSRPY